MFISSNFLWLSPTYEYLIDQQFSHNSRSIVFIILLYYYYFYVTLQWSVKNFLQQTQSLCTVIIYVAQKWLCNRAQLINRVQLIARFVDEHSWLVLSIFISRWPTKPSCIISSYTSGSIEVCRTHSTLCYILSYNWWGSRVVNFFSQNITLKFIVSDVLLAPIWYTII